jgi:hypothetical protein
MNTARFFLEFYEASFKNESDPREAKKRMDDFFMDFIYFTPIKLELLGSYLSAGQINLFYKSLIDLKYLIEFSDNINRYWHVLRGYSETLSKLTEDPSVKNSKRLYCCYFEKYGDRRTIRNEHWFEKQRWEFLDELNNIFTDIELHKFIRKYIQVLEKNFEIYKSFMMIFINELQKLQSVSLNQKIES